MLWHSRQSNMFSLYSTYLIQINTASRMESNGVRGRIHVSQQTADELIASGKRAWIYPREEKVVAKGKGELQTFFVNPASRDGPFTSMGNPE